LSLLILACSGLGGEKMPIEMRFKPRYVSDAEFREIDFQVMGLAFDIQNEMGRFWSEQIYQNELAYRCTEAGFEKVVTEAPIRVSFKDFDKTYSADLLINDAVVYELKAVEALTGEHKNQTLNYLFLTGLNHGKLINLRPPSVKSEFVSTKMTTEKRFDFVVDDSAWKNTDEDCTRLKNLTTEMLFEWGAFLDIELYYQAINHFWGGEENVVRKTKVVSSGRTIGEQKVHALNDNVAFRITAILKDHQKYEQQLEKFLRFTTLTALQWINFNRDHITFKTIFP
jgi:GxxExxY protein